MSLDENTARTSLAKKAQARCRLYFRERNFRRRMRRNHSAAEAIVLSFPKCGRTWHRVLLGYYVAKHVGADPRRALDLADLCKQAGLRRPLYTHNGSNPTHHLPSSSRVVGSPIEWRGKHVLVLVRDPRDTMVSAFFHVSRRERQFEGTISEFIRTPAFGIEKLMTAWNRWDENRSSAGHFEVASYEGMHRAPDVELTRMLKLLGLTAIDPALIQEAVEFSSFDNMRQYEARNYFGNQALAQVSEDPQSAKVRKGRVGSYLEHLNADDLAFIDSEIKRLGDPFARFWQLQPS